MDRNNVERLDLFLGRLQKLLIVQFSVIVEIIVFDGCIHFLHGHFLLCQLELTFGDVSVFVPIHGFERGLAGF